MSKKTNAVEREESRDVGRLTRLLSDGPANLAGLAADGRLVVEADVGGCISVPREALEDAARRGLVARHGFVLTLTAEGRAFARRHGSDEPFLDQHRRIELHPVEIAGKIETVRVNSDESPLSGLMRRKTADGRAYLSQREFRAGERLRADFTRGQMSPRLGIEWAPRVSSSGGSEDRAALTDAALAARHRVNRAMRAVGPELSGVLIDICCFLKGVEIVEVERRWPARSAKLMLKTGLAALSRHYEPQHADSSVEKKQQTS